MATRSRIGLKLEDGTIKSIYCHWDGYLECNGAILKEHYTDPVKISELLELGDLSVLGKDLGGKHDFDTAGENNICTAYGRDRGETETKAKVHKDVDGFLSRKEEFNYLFEPEKGWTVFDYNGKKLKF